MDPREKRNLYAREYYHSHKAKLLLTVKKYREKNRERLIQISKDYYYSHKEEIKVRNKNYRLKNRAKLSSNERRWRDQHKELVKEYQKEYQRNNRARINELSRINSRKYYQEKKRDPLFFLPRRLRGLINSALKRGTKKGSAIELLGCSIPEFKIYIESLFLPEMSWGNYGYYGWHIDHIIPLSFFDLTEKRQLAQACHYTNMQPLWRFDNQSKGGSNRTMSRTAQFPNGTRRPSNLSDDYPE